jgi:uncharacterized RDD family membrane protein YckC
VYCANCGTQLAADARYCANCGTAVGGSPAPAAAPPPPYQATAAMPNAKDRPPILQTLPASLVLSSPWRRLGASLLDTLLGVVTLFVGWLIWSLIVWNRGQTPAKQLLGMRTIDRESLHSAGWGRMLLRELPCKLVISIVASVTLLGFILYFWLLWDGERQELWDKMAGTLVVNDPGGVLDPRRAGESRAM